MNFLWAPEGMTIEGLNKHYRQVLTSFYSQPRIPWYYTKLTLQNPVHLARLLKFAGVLLKAKLQSLLGIGNKQALNDYAKVELD
jgi:hypothetical protein